SLELLYTFKQRTLLCNSIQVVSERFMSTGNAVKLGELLIRSGILTSQQLLESIELAKQTGTPIGRMLVMCGTVSENVLHGSVQIQSLLRENQLDLDAAIALLTMVHAQDIPLEEAME